MNTLSQSKMSAYNRNFSLSYFKVMKLYQFINDREEKIEKKWQGMPVHICEIKKKEEQCIEENRQYFKP